MIVKKKLADWIIEQLGTKLQLRLQDEEPSDLSNRIIHAARLEDIATRMLNQIIANSAQIVAQRGGIHIARTKAEKSRGENYAAFPNSKRGSVMEGKGKQGVRPIYMSDMGCYGWRHPWFLVTGKDSVMGQKVRSFFLEVEGWMFKPFIDENDEQDTPAEDEWTSRINIFPGASIDPVDWENACSNHGLNVKFYATNAEDPDEDTPGDLYNFASFYLTHLGGTNFTNWLLFEERMRKGEDYDSLLEYGFFNEVRPTIDGEVKSSIENYPGLSGYNHESLDHSGTIQDEQIRIMEARCIGLTGARFTNPRTTVAPGQNMPLTVPRVSPARVPRPIPSTWRTLTEIGTPQNASHDLKVYIMGVIKSIEEMEADALNQSVPETKVQLKKALEDQKKGFIQCHELTAGMLEGFLFQHDLKEKIQDICYDTDDNAPRSHTKKYSLKNKATGGKKK